MIKRTVYFGNPAYLSLHLQQLMVRLPEVVGASLPIEFKKEAYATIPIEDIGVVLFDHQQITITQGLISSLLDANCAVIHCDKSHMPVGLLLPLCGNNTQTESFRAQIEASEPLKKQMWQQTVSSKILNQARVLQRVNGVRAQNMLAWVTQVRSGDTENLEARAAAYYWKEAFDTIPHFLRDRDGEWPNAMLNYGYAILRAVTARALVSSGLLPTFGIHHRNKYNAYCLADDVMEPYRPYVDELVMRLVHEYGEHREIDAEIRKELLHIPALDVMIGGHSSPLMVGMSQTTASIQRCFSGESRKIIYPEIE